LELKWECKLENMLAIVLVMMMAVMSALRLAKDSVHY
jgi:hypothetical protein